MQRTVERLSKLKPAQDMYNAAKKQATTLYSVAENTNNYEKNKNSTTLQNKFSVYTTILEKHNALNGRIASLKKIDQGAIP